MPQRWSNNAVIRRKQIETGIDLTFNNVFKPIFIECIAKLAPRSILEIGAGTGHLSKELSGQGYQITAIEPSQGMFKIAEEVLFGSNVILINCSSFELQSQQKYDLALSHLVAHVVDDLNGFLSSIALQLISGGHYIFSIPHPCFYNDYKKIFATEYNYMSPLTKNISFKITKDELNEISGVPYHHRPLSTYINSITKAGITINSFDEIYPAAEIQKQYGSTWETPRYCMFTCSKH